MSSKRNEIDSSVVMGIDQALLRSGVVILDAHGGILHAGHIKTKSSWPTVQRLVAIRESVLELVQVHRPTLLVREGFSYNSYGNALFELGGVGYLIDVLAHDAGLDLLVVAPAARAKFATGKGNAKKSQVVRAAEVKWGFKAKSHDIADAFVLARVGLTHCGMPTSRREELDVVRKLHARP